MPRIKFVEKSTIGCACRIKDRSVPIVVYACAQPALLRASVNETVNASAATK
jgi:hypothetical protein